MSKLKYLLVILLILSLLASSGCALCDRGSSSSYASGVPINSNWQPIYIDDEVGGLLTAAELVEKIAPTVVSIFTEEITYDIFLQPTPTQSAGSGVVIDPKGYIVTNCHVVEDADTVTIAFSDGQIFEAERWVTDPWTDLAVVQIKSDDDLPYAHFLHNSLEQLELLEEVVAVGNAYARGTAWTKGVVSFLGEAIQEENGVVLYDLIRTDAAINPGNSGGPLVNMAGGGGGINNDILAEAENMGFVISTDTAIPVIYDLIRKGYVPLAWLGVSITAVTPDIKSRYNLSIDYGALIVEVVTDGPADKASPSSLKENDIIIKFGDKEINTGEELVSAIQSC